jgi:hypothetical protein
MPNELFSDHRQRVRQASLILIAVNPANAARKAVKIEASRLAVNRLG